MLKPEIEWRTEVINFIISQPDTELEPLNSFVRKQEQDEKATIANLITWSESETQSGNKTAYN